MWPNIDIDGGINHDDILFYNDPDRTNSEKLQYLEHKFPGTGFPENSNSYSGNKGTYVRGFHLNERIASFLLLDPAIPQPIFEIISNSFIENFCNCSKEKDVIQNKAKHLSYEEIATIINKTTIPQQYSHTFRSYKFPYKPLKTLKKYKEKFIQIKYRLFNLYSDEGYDRSDNRAPKCTSCKTINNPEIYILQQDLNKPPPRIHYCRCSPNNILPMFILKNTECGTVKEIKWRLQNVGEAFSIYKNNNNNETRKNIINLNFVMCKILELMHLPNLTQFWPMISSSERLSKVVNFWSDLIIILRKEEVNRCRVCKGNPEHHIFMWGLKYTDLCYPCVGKRFLRCKAIYFPWINNDPHVVTTKQYTEYKEKENNIYFQKGYYPSDLKCPGWYVIEEAIKKKRQEKDN
ncbi:hypothetical protein ACTFIY_004568 [Dictyostelium cf. discoideum]